MSRSKSDIPEKVNVETLRNHFKINYRLSEDQIDLMIESSSKSLKKSLAELYETLDSEGNNLEELSKLGHNMKGLLLNMGEQAWADVARTLELSAAGGKEIDYRDLVVQLHKGVEDVL